jgi:hypothetical protein
MPTSRSHARLQVRRVTDQDWRALSPLAAWLYDELLLTPDLTVLGTQSLLPRQWAKRNVGTNVITMTEEIIEALIVELETARYIVVDRDTDEVLTRTFLRNDGIASNHTMLLSVCRKIGIVRSPRLRDEIAVELERIRGELPIPVNSKRPKLYEQTTQALDEAIKTLTGGTSPTPHATPHPTPHAMGDTTPHATPHSTPHTTPEGTGQTGTSDPPSDPPPDGGSRNPGEGEGEGEGEKVPVSRGGRAHTRARPREAEPPPPTPIRKPRAQDVPAAPCGTHPDDNRPCHRCKDIRLATPKTPPPFWK